MRQRKKVFVHLDSGRGYSRDILKGIYDYNNQLSHWDIVFEPAYFLRSDSKRNNLSIINTIKPDACILEFSDNIPELIKMGIPVIQVTSVNHVPGVPYVSGNYESDGKLAAEYFRRKGFRHLAFFGLRNLRWSETRLESFKKHIGLAEETLHTYLLEGNEVDVLSNNFERLALWLKELPKPVGILCCNDNFGQILINSSSIADLKVPHEVAVLGIDNDELLCNITYPNLSSIIRNHHKIAFDICNLLEEMMEGKDCSDRIIPAEALDVFERSSSDTIASQDPDVSQAINFILENLRSPLTVSDVASHCKVPSRILNKKFRDLTGYSVHQEIQLRKLNQFKRMLESKKTIKEIAFELGFEDASHISRWFANLEGTTPLIWKKKFL
ncbi:DNA-binding transcriptional regulator [Desertivirga brevis]|uniref:DNA-binding transcriptional regulator n=1 Tax=Desertivirga brevis TaxID=2810310 RepID=UPI001A95A73C|nr:DNA-binding transcriptional regulator [Pedobacter sp. SYSU D00873]